MQAKEYEGIPCDWSSGATFMKKEYEKEPDLVGATSYPANIRLDEDVLKTSFVFVFRRRLQDVFKTS